MRTHAGDPAIREAEIGGPFPGTIENQQLVLDEHGFGDYGARAAGAGQSGNCRQHMQKKDGQIAHRTILARSRNPRNAHEFAIRHARPAAATTIKGAELFRVSNDQNISDSVTRARAALDRASADAPNVYRYMFNQDPNAGDPATLLDALWNVAREGWDVFYRLVPDEKGQEAVRTQLASGMGIHAAHIDAGAVIPWSLVYDRKVFYRKTLPDPADPRSVVPVEPALCRASMPAADGTMATFECGAVPACLLHPTENDRRRAAGQPLVCANTVICPRRFWGFMHPIEVPVQQVSGVKTQESATTPLKKEIDAATPIAVVVSFNPNLYFAKRHADRLKDLQDTSGAPHTTAQRARLGPRSTGESRAGHRVFLLPRHCSSQRQNRQNCRAGSRFRKRLRRRCRRCPG